MRLENGAVGGGRGVEGDLGAHLLALLFDLHRILPGHNEDARGKLDSLRVPTFFLCALGDGGLYGPSEILGGVEGVDVEAVTELAGQGRQPGVDAGYVDRDLRVLYGTGVEERRHERVPVELALEAQRPLGLEGVPDGAESHNVLAQPRDRPVPRHGEAALHVRLYLGSETEYEAPVREI